MKTFNHHHKLLILTLAANLLVFSALFFHGTEFDIFKQGGLTAQVAGTTGVYVVSKDGFGNFKTIQACAEIVKAGETCRVEAGKYDEFVAPVNSGVKQKPISFVTNGKVKVRGFKLDNKNHIKVNGFEITSLGFSSDVFPGIFLESSNYITITNNTIHDTISDCIGMRNQFAANLSNYNHIKGNTIYNCGLGRATGPGVGISVFGHNNLVEDNDISHVGNIFIKVTGGDRNVIRKNTLRDNTPSDVTGSISGKVDGIRVECSPAAPVAIHYLLIDGNQQSNTPSSDSHFFNYENTSQCGSGNFIVRYNVVKNIGGTVAVADRSIKKVIYYSNIFPDPLNSFVTPIAAQDGRLTKVSMLDGGQGAALLVEDVSMFQDGWAGITPDYVAVGTQDNVSKILAVNYSGSVLTLVTGLDRSPGDPVWFYKYNGQQIPVRKNPKGTFYSSDKNPPSVPSDLKTNLVLVDEIDLTWPNASDDVGVTGYKLYRDGDEIATTRTGVFRDTTVEPNTIYEYWVIAVDAADNESTRSIVLQVTTPPRTPGDKTPPKKAKTPEPTPVVSITPSVTPTPIPVIPTPTYTPLKPKATPKVVVTPSITPTPTPIVEEPVPVESIPVEEAPSEQFEFTETSDEKTLKAMVDSYMYSFKDRWGKAVKIFGL